MLSDALEEVKLRKNFYRDCYWRALNFLLFSFSLIVVLLLLIAFFILTKEEPGYYATSNAGKITLLDALHSPNYFHTPLIP